MFPNTNIFIQAFIEQREYEESLFKINLIQGVTLIKRNNKCIIVVWICCYPDRLHPVPAEFQETGVQRKGHTWGGVCITT